jgi:hypothetical protein
VFESIGPFEIFVIVMGIFFLITLAQIGNAWLVLTEMRKQDRNDAASDGDESGETP